MEPEADCKTRGVFRGLRCGGGGGGDRKGGPIRLEGNGLREKERETSVTNLRLFSNCFSFSWEFLRTHFTGPMNG